MNKREREVLDKDFLNGGILKTIKAHEVAQLLKEVEEEAGTGTKALLSGITKAYTLGYYRGEHKARTQAKKKV